MKTFWVLGILLISVAAQAGFAPSHEASRMDVQARLTDYYGAGIAALQDYETAIDGLRSEFSALADSDAYSVCFNDRHGLGRLIVWSAKRDRKRQLESCAALAGAMLARVDQLRGELLKLAEEGFAHQREALREAAQGSGTLQRIVADALRRFQQQINLGAFQAGNFSLGFSVAYFTCSQFAALENPRGYRECILDATDLKIRIQTELYQTSSPARALTDDLDALLLRVAQAQL
jgi:hypothetical protein